MEWIATKKIWHVHIEVYIKILRLKTQNRFKTVIFMPLFGSGSFGLVLEQNWPWSSGG